MGARKIGIGVVTPFEITILLEAYSLARGSDEASHPTGIALIEALRRLTAEGLRRLIAEGLIERRVKSGAPPAPPPVPRLGDPLGILLHTTYHTTPKGDYYVKHGLCTVPFPVERTEFVIPEPTAAEDCGPAFKVNIDVLDDQGGAGGTI